MDKGAERLARMADAAMHYTPERRLALFVESLTVPASALMALMGIKEDAVRKAARAYLEERAEGACQVALESQASPDRSSARQNGGTRQEDPGSRSSRDRSAEPAWTPEDIQVTTGSAPSQHSSESQRAPDRRVPRPSAPGVSEERKAAAAKVAMDITKSVFERFRITDRNGARIPIGEVYIHSLPRLIKMTIRRAWATDRERVFLQLMQSAAEMKGSIPNDAKTNDIFTEFEVEHMLKQAVTMATPNLGDDEKKEADKEQDAA